MKAGVIQSNYIPWRGYFDFIDDVDLFIYLDDTQYTKRDWRNRNRIKTSSGLVWLTVPVIFSRHGDKLNIEDVPIDYSQRWINKHIESIKHAYSKAPFFSHYSDEFFNLLNQKFKYLSELNININNWIMKQLNIDTTIRMSSEYNACGAKTERLIDLLKKVGATTYLSGSAAKAYLDVEKFKEAGIGLEYKTYNYPEYPQQYGKFEPQVTILDLLFNCGEDSRNYLKSLNPNEKVNL